MTDQQTRWAMSAYGTDLILCFRSPAAILTTAGMETAAAGDCIIHSPGFRQYHCRAADAAAGYRNDWLHVRPSALAALMAQLRLPFDCLIPTGQPEILTPFILRMGEELANGDEWSGPMVLNQLAAMLLAIARSQSTATSLQNMRTASERRHFPAFSQLRREIRENCVQGFTVGELAAHVHLSPERFSVLYRALFGTTPYADILAARLIKAKSLLSSTGLTVKEVAAACGWDDHHYFSRLFKRKTGASPSMYRASVLPRRPRPE